MKREKRKFVNVIPLTRIAKNRFIHHMNSFHGCTVKEETDDMMYLISLNKEYEFWIQKSGNEHWKIVK